MNLIVFGATGRSGKHVVRQALDKGYFVTAVARDPSKLDITHAHLKIIQGDVLQLRSFINAMQNQDAVVSTLGSDDSKPTMLYSEGMNNIITAMQRYSVKRILCISASAVKTSPKLNVFIQLATKVLQRILKNPYRDILRMEHLLKQTDLEWTVVRPPRLTDGGLKNNYRFAVNDWLPNCIRISRADLAHFMLQHICSNNIYRSIVEVAY
ncbi:MAG TPA: SDR family oxidoreductase [Chitinophagaceae bacterium]